MIGHSVKGKGFRGCLNYNLNPNKEAEVIGGNMAGQTPRDLAAEFGQVRQLNSRVKTPCWHVSLSAVPGESLSNDQWNEVADRYLDRMGLDRAQHQYVVVRHHDTKHQHVHIVANRIGFEGQANYLKWHKKDTKKATRYLERQFDYLQETCKRTEKQRAKLEQDYQLPEAPRKRGVIQGQYWRVQREQNLGIDVEPIQQQELQRLISEVLQQTSGWNDFVQRLSNFNVNVRIRTDSLDNSIGLSYQINGVALPGFALGESYTLASVQKNLQLPQRDQQFQTEESHESERDVPRQRRELATDGARHAVESDSEVIETDSVQAESDRGKDGTHTPDGTGIESSVLGVGETDSGFTALADCARDFDELEDLFAGIGETINPARSVIGEVERDWSEVVRLLGDESESSGIEQSESFSSEDIADSIIVHGGNKYSSTTAAGNDAAEQSSLESGERSDVTSDAKTYADSNDLERQAIELENVDRDVSADRPMSDDRGYSDHDDDLKFKTDSAAGANQRQGEQFGDQSEEDTEPVNQEQQRILKLVNTWRDEQLFQMEQAVKDYWKKRPPEPDLMQGQRYLDRLDALKIKQQDLKDLLFDQQKRVKMLGKPRSWRYPFGSSPKEVDQAEKDVLLTQVELKENAKNMASVETEFQSWQKPVQRFNEWLNSEMGQSMHQGQKILQVSEVQERLTGIHEEQKRQQVLNALHEWGNVAQNLGKSEAYRQRIREVTEDYRQRIPLSQRTKQALMQDLKVHHKFRSGLSL